MADTFLEVNLQHLYDNVTCVKKYLHPDTQVMAVVKSNAYGHGSVEIAKALLQDVACFGVGLLEEAVELREAGIDKPILLMGPTYDFERVCKHNIMISICSINHLEQVVKWTSNHQKTIRYHLKVETGMNRFGIAYNEAKTAIDLCQAATYGKLEGVYSHFATTYKSDKDFVGQQKRKFDQFVEFFKSYKDPLIFHMANSENTIDYKDAHYNMVRLGNALYGPCNSQKRIGLKKVACLKGNICYEKPVKAGENIGYGRSYKAKKDMIIGIVSMGFYDGIGLMKKPIGSKMFGLWIYYLKEIYRYMFRSKTPIYYDSKPLEILGRPNMQYTIVDITDIDKVQGETIEVEIRISPIFIKENIRRTYIAEV
ncbi:alanine racemase [Vallitalea pronyensis]|uniref:Alanine racemase n=1 Tax=Vallitalea pronyensis TaxID=1348613 RepID=A0A8J8SHA7_9FIRM|nr:alanine racemase [Vallitalea pronyensis]QUI23217.1 alanine racemase [Vallitalea pronyensis]